MKKNKNRTTVLNYRYFSVYYKLVCFSCLMFFSFSASRAQCDLTCNDNVQISLDQDCYKEITADMILEGTYDPDCEPFTVIVENTGSNYVNGDHIGQTLTVSVTASNNNICWGSIFVVDENAPEIDCQTVTITCLEDPDDVGPPDVEDNCDDPDLSYTETIVENGCSGQYYKIITRTYTAVDSSGNSSTCDHIINVIRPSLSQVDFPSNLDDIQSDALDCDNPDTDPSNTGEPTIDGHSIDNICSFSIDYTDQEIDICQNSYKILREWTVFDWCSSQNIINTQIIKVIDKSPPTIVCPNDLEVSTGNNDCLGSVTIPSPNVSDDCSSSSSIVIEYSSSAGSINGSLLYNLPIGTHTLTYTAIDDCGNSSSCSIDVIVEDNVAPLVICETNLTIGLSSTEPTLIGAQIFDDGSSDHCGDVTFLARRMDTNHCPGNDGSDLSSYVPFYCCDVGNIVMVELQVIDEEGNSNSCMVETTVVDEVNPVISCPPDITLDCSEDFNDLAVTGEATASDNCNATISYSDFENDDNCGGGEVIRTWTAADDFGNTSTCPQIITLVNSTPFFITDTNCNNNNPNDGVIWPCDFDTNSCGAGLDPSVTGEPEIFEDFCDLIAVTYEDTYLPITEPACVKVLREWIIVDWCQFDDDTGEGYWEYTQVIKVFNSDNPNILTSCDDKAFCSYDENCLEGPADLILEANDDCTDSIELNYNYWIDINNDGSNDHTGSTNDASGIYDLGTHKILWHVEDGCGNVSVCEYLFIISDCKAPTPNVLNGIAFELMETCEIDVLATALDNPSSPSFDNCEIDHWLIQSPSQGPGQSTPPGTAQPSWLFSHLDLGTQTVDIWIQDVNGNWAYSSSYVVVQDNVAPFCPSIETVGIQGIIETEELSPVNNVIVDVSLSGFPDPSNDTISTDSAGFYKILNLLPDANYVVTPEKNDNPLNGVTTYDLVLIGKHILQIDTLDSPYKIIAADANNSGSVTTLDLVDLRKLILFIEPDFPNNNSWRFVDSDFIFPNSLNPWETSFPEIFTVNGLPLGITEANFTAIKIGDVNGSANTSAFSDTNSRNNGEPLILEIENQRLEAGKEYKIHFKSNKIKSILGYQFTLEFDTDVLSFQNIHSTALEGLNRENFGLNHIDDGLITTCWNHILPIKRTENDYIFTLQFKALEDAQLSNLINITSDLTQAVAYDQSEAQLAIELGFITSEKGLVLYQNRPNPFDDQTKISFNLPSSGETTISIFDASGRLVKEIKKNFPRGYNEVIVTDKDILSKGVFYYQLKNAGSSIIKKMVHTGSKT